MRIAFMDRTPGFGPDAILHLNGHSGGSSNWAKNGLRKSNRRNSWLTGNPEVMPRNKLSTMLARSRFGAITPSGEFQSEVVVYGLAEFLLAAKIAAWCLNEFSAR